MKKQKVLVLGGTGMAGHMICAYLEQLDRYEVSNIVYRKLLNEKSIVCDVEDKEKLESIIHRLHPDVIINGIGALISQSRTTPEEAIYLNAYLPHYLVRLARGAGGKLIHISTDCVFSGQQGHYKENDFRDADDRYGRSKALGEVINEKDITIRTSIIGPELKTDGEGLFNWFHAQQGAINGFTRAMWSGVTTLELAKAVARLLEVDAGGLYHLTNGIPISKFDLLQEIKAMGFSKVTSIEPFDAYQTDKSLLPSERFDFQVPTYRDMLLELSRFMQQYPDMYKRYLSKNVLSKE